MRRDKKKNQLLRFTICLKTHLEIISRVIYSTKFTHEMAINLAMFKTSEFSTVHQLTINNPNELTVSVFCNFKDTDDILKPKCIKDWTLTKMLLAS